MLRACQVAGRDSDRFIRANRQSNDSLEKRIVADLPNLTSTSTQATASPASTAPADEDTEKAPVFRAWRRDHQVEVKRSDENDTMSAEVIRTWRD